MTKTLETLIKMAKHELDGHRRDLKVYQEKKDELLEKKRVLKERLEAEAALFAKMPEAQYAFSSYAINVGVQQENLDKFVAAMDTQIDAIMEKIHEDFQTMKRYEILQDIKQEEAEKELARLERIELDEMGMNGFRRKEGSS